MIIRADADPQIGFGHVMRCLALAQAWQDRGDSVTFVAHESLPGALRQRLSDEHMNLRIISERAGWLDDAQALISAARETNAPVIVVDGYQFGSNYQQWIKAAGIPLLVLDDNADADMYDADWVLNQNPHAARAMYAHHADTTQFLLGTRYALLRREFWRWRGRIYVRPLAGRKVLVTMGGTDPQKLTGGVINRLERIEAHDLDVVIVVSADNPDLPSLQAAVNRSRHTMRLQTNLTDMAPLMDWADLAISAAGSTLWELALMGVPTCAIITAKNQQAGAEAFAASGAIKLLDADFSPDVIRRLLQDEQQLSTLSQRAQTFVDGWGAERVIMRLRGERLWLRPAQQADARQIWSWANEPIVRAASFNSDAISWEDHRRWFEDRLSDPKTLILIGANKDDTPIGQVRFAVEADEATISVMVTGEQQGQGYGTALIDLGAAYLFHRTDVRVISAYIKVDNSASSRAFEKAGFTYVSDVTIRNCPAQLYTRRR